VERRPPGVCAQGVSRSPSLKFESLRGGAGGGGEKNCLRRSMRPPRAKPALSQCPSALLVASRRYDVIEDLYSTKTAAMHFLQRLCRTRRKSQLDAVMAQLVGLLKEYAAAAAAAVAGAGGARVPREVERRMDGALLAIGSLEDVMKVRGGDCCCGGCGDHRTDFRAAAGAAAGAPLPRRCILTPPALCRPSIHHPPPHPTPPRRSASRGTAPSWSPCCSSTSPRCSRRPRATCAPRRPGWRGCTRTWSLRGAGGGGTPSPPCCSASSPRWATQSCRCGWTPPSRVSPEGAESAAQPSFPVFFFETEYAVSLLLSNAL
jgi:hypothetical protein